ncbi:MAG: hypothetical protein DSY55_00860 [Clostridia bacterium]|nr:MAG: hypothetical protein DSY55_00860 [Clostridia bacterium]
MTHRRHFLSGIVKALLMLIVVVASLTLLAACVRGPAGNTPAPDASAPALQTTESAQSEVRATEIALMRQTPSVASTQTLAPTSTPTPGPTVAPDLAVLSVVVHQNEFLGTIAARYGVSLDDIITFNHIENPDAVAVGQRLLLPYHTSRITPDHLLLPDSELVYGPAYLDFDIAAFVAEQGGYLASFTMPWVVGEKTGAELVRWVAEHYSVGPRVLLALLEARTGWVTHPETPQGYDLDYPLGHLATGGGLEVQLEWAADTLNAGFYGWMDRGETAVRFQNGVIARGAPDLNPGTIALQRTLAEDTTFQNLPDEINAFMDAYHHLFGDPDQYDQGRALPWDLTQPRLQFPWQAGQWWFLTGGPHGAWGNGSSWAALDIVPEDAPVGGCTPAETWVRAASEGLVVRNDRGELLVDLDEDGDMRTGWVLQYLHLTDRVPEGTVLQPGDPVGRPACDGGQAASSHLHLARRYNGVWVAAGGPVPLQLDGWTAFSGRDAYGGGLFAPDGRKASACDCRDQSINGIWIEK